MGRRLPEVLDEGECRALLLQAKATTLSGLRNRLGMALLWRCGLRVGEIVALRPGDLNLGEGSLRVVQGKGGKDRVCWMDDEVIDLCRLWFARRDRPRSEYLLPTIQRGRRGSGETVPGGQMSVRYWQIAVARLAKAAGIEKRVHPHLLRHSFATQSIANGVPLHEVMADMGHANLATTAVYLHVQDNQRQARARTRRPVGLLEGAPARAEVAPDEG